MAIGRRFSARQLARRNERRRTTADTRSHNTTRCVPSTAFVEPWPEMEMPKIVLSKLKDCIVASLRGCAAVKRNRPKTLLLWPSLQESGRLKRRMKPIDLKHAPTQASHGLREKSSEPAVSMPPASPGFPVATPSDTPFGHRFAAIARNLRVRRNAANHGDFALGEVTRGERKATGDTRKRCCCSDLVVVELCIEELINLMLFDRALRGRL